jgi:7-carboxy-7-deazaguanine synthase
VLKVNEIFYSIQGESDRAGRPCVFVRLTGCALRCSWCDTEYAFHEGRPMSVDEVVDEVARHPCRLVEITGGEPLLQKDAVPLMQALLHRGYEVLLETAGSEPIDRVPEPVVRIVDLKCPGSGEASRNRWENVESLRPSDQVKFVVRDRADYDWAVDRIRETGLLRRCPILLSPVQGELDPAELASWMLEDGLEARLQIQLHKILWPGVVRGV